MRVPGPDHRVWLPPGLAGPGRWRGGNGIREYTTTTDTEMSLWFEPSGNPAWGLFGGKDGVPPEVVVNPRNRRVIRRLETKRMSLREGELVRCYTGGAGGYGNPLDRDPQAVQADFTDGHISPRLHPTSPPID